MVQFELMTKDYIKFYFLNEVLHTKTTDFNLYLEIEDSERNFLDIKSEANVYRFSNFNVSEDNLKNCITFRPIIIGCYTYFRIDANTPTIVEIVRNGSNTVADSFTLAVGESKIVFAPQGAKKYTVTVSDDNLNNKVQYKGNTVRPQSSTNQSINEEKNVQESINEEKNIQKSINEEMNIQKSLNENRNHFKSVNEDIDMLSSKIEEMQAKNAILEEKKKNLEDTLEKIKNEYEKNYSNFENELEELKSKYKVDKEVLMLYSDSAIKPIEELLAQADAAIEKVEEQIRIFIMARQKKTAQIEDELQIGRKE